MIEVLWICVRCLGIIIMGVFAGNGAVYFFNKVPATWLCDYDEEPSEELKDPYAQRVKSYPWKYVFTMLFVILGIKMVMKDWQFAVAGVCAIWLLLEMSIADVKYRIVPDQFILLLAITALGFIPFHFDWLSSLFGAITGFCIMGLVGFAGKIANKRATIGGGDIKLFAALGLIMGVGGTIFVFAGTAFFSAAHFIYLLARKKITMKDSMPMVPYIALAATIYLVFFWQKLQILYL